MGARSRSLSLGVSLALLILGSVDALENEGPVVTEVRLGTRDGALLIEITATAPMSYALVEESDPFTLTLHFLNARFGFPLELREIDDGALRRIVPAMLEREESRVGRLTLLFARKVPYRLRPEGRRLLLHVGFPGVAERVVLGIPPSVPAVPVEPESEIAPPPKQAQADLHVATARPPAGSVGGPPSEPAPVPARATRVHGVTLVKAGSETRVRVEADGVLTYRAFTLEAPSRLVVDFDDVAYRLAEGSVRGSGGLLKGIRSSRFRVKPTSVVRIVLDLTRTVPYWIESQARGVVVHLGAAASPPGGTTPSQ